MSKSKISIIVAMSTNRVIGRKNKLPWNIPGELKRFREITDGHPIIMGRKTHESIGRVLPNRTNIVITRDPGKIVPQEGLIAVSSLDEALRLAKHASGNDEIFVIGGGQIYEQALPKANKLYLSIIEGDFEGDVFFPEFENLFTKKILEKNFEENGQKYKFLELER